MKTRGAAAAAILQNGDVLEQVYYDAVNNAAGAGEKAVEASLDSIEVKVTKFTNALKKLATDFINSEFIKQVVDFGTETLTLLDKLVQKNQILSTAITGGLLFAIQQVVTQGPAFRSVLELIDGQRLLSGLDVSAIRNFATQMSNTGADAVQVVETVSKTTDAATAAVLKDLGSGEKQLSNYTKALKATETAALSLKIALVALAAYAVIKGIDKAVTTVSEYQDKIDDLTSSLKDLNSEYDELNNKDADAITVSEKERLAYLERRIELEERLKTIEEQKQADEKYNDGTGGIKNAFSRVFDEDNAQTRKDLRTAGMNRENGNDYFDYTYQQITNATTALDELDEEMEAYKERQESINISSLTEAPDSKGFNPHLTVEKPEVNFDDFTEKETENLDVLKENYSDAVEYMNQWYEYYQEYTTDANNENLTEHQRQEAKAYADDAYEAYMNMYKAVFSAEQKLGSEYFTETDALYNQMLDKFSGLSLEDLLGSTFDTSDIEKILSFDFSGIDTSKLGILDLYKMLINSLQAEADKNPVEISVTVSKKSMISSINDMAEGFDSLSDIWNDIADGETFDYTALVNDDFEEAFSGLGTAYEDFIETVSNSPSDIEACKTAFNNLATAYINQSGILDTVSENTANVTEAMLTNMGITNAHILVTQSLVSGYDGLNAKLQSAGVEVENLSELTADDVDALKDEVEWSDYAGTALAGYALKAKLAEGIDITNEEDVNYLLTIANAAGIATDAIAEYEIVMAKLSQYKLKMDAGTITDLDIVDMNALQQQADEISTRIIAKIEGAQVNIADFTSKTGDSSSSSSSEQEFDWIQTKIENLEKQIEKLGDAADSSYTSVNALSGALGSNYGSVEALVAEYQKIYDWNLGAYADEIKNGTLQSVFGNINMDKRTIINWSDELKQTYADALASWDYNPETGSIDTVFGGSNAFSFDGGEVEVAFSPILQTENGAKFLSQDSLYEYISSVLEQADEQVSASGNWSEADVFAKALEIDATTGIQVGEDYIKGVIAGITDYESGISTDDIDAGTIGALMHFAGNYGAINLSTPMETKALSLGDVVNKTLEYRLGLIQQEMELYNQEIDLQAQAYNKYMELANGVNLDESYKKLVREGAIDVSTITDSNVSDAISKYQEYYEAAQDAADAISDIQTNSDELWTSMYQLELDNLDSMHDTGAISEKEYLNRLQQLYEKYYANNIKYAEQYQECVISYLQEYESYLQSVANAASSVIQSQIDALENARDAQIDPLEEQQKLLEKRKDSLEDELNAIEEAKEDRENQLALEQALYNLRRAENQKTKLVYTSDQGMVYKTDDSAIKDAREEVEDAEYEIATDAIQDRIDAIDSQIDDLDDQIDRINEDFDKQIEGLQKLADAWQKAIDDITNAENIAILKEYFGDDSIVSKILSGEVNPSTGWTSDYIQTVTDLAAASGDGSLSETYETLKELYGLSGESFLSEYANIATQSETNQEAVEALRAAIAGGTASSDQGQGTTASGYTEPGSSSDLTSAIEASGEAGVTAAENHSTAIYDTMIPAIESETDFMNEFNKSAAEEINKTVNITYHTSGLPSGLIGNSKASGGSINKDLEALVGEEGPELVAHRNGTFETVGQNGAEFTNLQKGDLVFDANQTDELLKKGKIPTRGKAFASGNAKYVSLSDADPDKYSMLTKLTTTLTGTNGLTNMISNLNSNIKDMLSDINSATVNSTPNITFGDISVNCTGVTSQEVVQTISDTLEKSFSGLALSAYQRSKISK